MGLYTAPPGERMAYDIDGSIGFIVDPAGTVTALTSADLAALNNEDPRDGFTFPNWASASYGYIGLLFPQQRDLDHYYFGAPFDHLPTDYSSIQTTANSTTGNDGTWTVRNSLMSPDFGLGSTNAPPQSNYRDTIRTVSGAPGGCTGIRFRLAVNGTGQRLHSMHVFGVITAGQTPDRLRFWHPTIDQALSVTPALLDFGDVARGTTYTKTLRVKNNSSTLTAHAPVLTIAAPTDSASITQLGEMSLSGDGGSTWHAGTSGDPLTLADIAPGALSAVVTVRRVKDIASPLGAWTQRLRAVAASWS